ncbi:MAG: hypothetical protein OEV55_03255, partial [candidate division Zixibacteria bacterium]|nr:hypothetical protein [candidate division Zixibacteria bacterium]
MKNKILLSIILLIILTVLISFYNCTKKSTRFYYHSDQYLYASDIGSSERKQIYVFSTLTDSLVDSIYLGPDLEATALGLSPDKRNLYARCERILSDTSREYLGCEIDTRTKRLKYIGPNSFPIISPDGKYLFGSIGNQFTIFDAYNHTVVYQDSILFWPFCFDKKALLAYGIRLGGKDAEKIRIFNYKTMCWADTFTIHMSDGRPLWAGHAVLSPNGNILYLLTSPDYMELYFSVYDLKQDSLLANFIVNTTGQLAIKPDGNAVYITDPGHGPNCMWFGEPPPTGFLGVFDTRTNTPLPGIYLDSLAD